MGLTREPTASPATGRLATLLVIFLVILLSIADTLMPQLF